MTQLLPSPHLPHLLRWCCLFKWMRQLWNSFLFFSCFRCSSCADIAYKFELCSNADGECVLNVNCHCIFDTQLAGGSLLNQTESSKQWTGSHSDQHHAPWHRQRSCWTVCVVRPWRDGGPCSECSCGRTGDTMRRLSCSNSWSGRCQRATGTSLVTSSTSRAPSCLPPHPEGCRKSAMKELWKNLEIKGALYKQPLFNWVVLHL